MPSQIHLNDKGTQFLATIRDQDNAIVNIATATVKRFIFKKPSEEVVEKNATFYTDGTDGKLYYITASGDLDELGNWQYQAYIEPGSDWFHSDTVTFRVERNLN